MLNEVNMSKLIEQLKIQEGLRLKPYQCTAGKWTIGYGRNLEDKGITTYEAEILLTHDVNAITAELSSAFEFWGNLNEARKAVLINMAFNIGVNGLMKFKKTLSYVRLGMYSDAGIEMMNSKWAKQVPNRAITLSAQMDLGVFS